MMGVKSN